MKNHKKLFLTILFGLFLLINLTIKVYAQDLSANPGDFSQLFVAFARLVNLLVGLSGAVFIVMLFIMAFQFSTSVDDPRGMETAKQTGTMALVGLLVVLGFFVIVRGLVSALGLNPALLSPTQTISEAARDLIDFVNQTPSTTSIWDSGGSMSNPGSPKGP